jgi:hypothetical protein
LDDLDTWNLLMEAPVKRQRNAAGLRRRAYRYRVLLAAAALLGAVVLPASARVFARWGAHRNVAALLATLGGQAGYTADVSINGQNGAACVYRLPGSLREVIATLEKRLPPLAFTHAGGSMATGTLIKDNVRQFLIVLRTGLADQTLVMAVTLTGVAGAKPPAAPPAHLLKQIPAYPGSDPVFYAHDRQAGMQLAVATARTDPDAVQRFYQSQLSQAGWKSALPRRMGNTHDFQVYLRDRNTCCVFAAPTATGRETRITLLHKEPGKDK